MADYLCFCSTFIEWWSDDSPKWMHVIKSSITYFLVFSCSFSSSSIVCLFSFDAILLQLVSDCWFWSIEYLICKYLFIVSFSAEKKTFTNNNRISKQSLLNRKRQAQIICLSQFMRYSIARTYIERSDGEKTMSPNMDFPFNLNLVWFRNKCAPYVFYFVCLKCVVTDSYRLNHK